MDVDDELRSRLQRDRYVEMGAVDARTVLGRLAPTMRRARRRRVATLSASAAIGAMGLVGTALAVENLQSDTTTVVEGTQPPDVTPSTTALDLPPATDHTGDTIAGSEPHDADRDPTGTPAEAGTSQPAASVTPTWPGGDGTDDGDDEVGDDDQSAPPAGGATTTTQPGTTSTTVTDVDDPPPSSEATTTTDDSGDDTGDDSHPDGSLDYQCRCGTVTVDQATGALDVHPAAGYTYHLEDIERHPDGTRTQAVHFEGGGEDCELTVPLP